MLLIHAVDDFEMQGCWERCHVVVVEKSYRMPAVVVVANNLVAMELFVAAVGNIAAAAAVVALVGMDSIAAAVGMDSIGVGVPLVGEDRGVAFSKIPVVVAGVVEEEVWRRVCETCWTSPFSFYWIP